MDLILAEQTLLIALDDEKGRDTTQWGSDAGLAGALLLDLARLELLSADADGKIVAGDGAQPWSATRTRRSASRPSAEMPKAGCNGCPANSSRCANGWRASSYSAASSPRSTPSGSASSPATRFPTIDPAPERELRARLQDILVTGRDPTEEEALLLGLLEPLGLIDSLVTKDQRRAARKRAKDVAEQGLVGTAVRDAIRAVQAGVIAAVVASTSSTASSN